MLSQALMTDLYQLTMMASYVDENMLEEAVFECFVRRLPENRNFIVVAGIEQLLDYVEQLKFSDEDIVYLKSLNLFTDKFLHYLKNFKFTGTINAVNEGSIMFPNQTLIQVIAPLPEAQFIESRLINLINFQSMIAMKAIRCKLMAPNHLLVDFGMRRAHGFEAALYASRANFIAGFQGTATVLAGKTFDIPVYGTMAHSYIQAHDDEKDAFYKFAKSHPENIVLLIDTYDTEHAALKVTELAKELEQQHININAVRLDSGDLGEHAIKVRKILDEHHCKDIKIFCSGDLDEFALQSLGQSHYPIDGFGIGTRLDTCHDAPSLDMVYKLQSYNGIPRRKKSEGKATWPGKKQVYRSVKYGKMVKDIVALVDETKLEGKALLRPMIQNGKVTAAKPKLVEIQAYCQQQLDTLPEKFKALECVDTYEVEFSKGLKALVAKMDAA